ncbi:hypothetical protein [Dialister micraerophilus]|jgi:hypothetical protein|uniref:hypothetical protein n=1 Tax=Dialister micraerophilus TaxID=309120 RepID=UPI0020470712|nr:hypothetical protein [Dialister micraerophilus]DAJ22916.1 MAG TPA: hypothetical protein [Caudoviricetes sp.]
MVTLFLIELNDKKAVYRYHPEDEEDFGLIEINIQNKTCRIIKKAQKITNSEYWGHALKRTRKMVSEQEYPKIAMAAWY